MNHRDDMAMMLNAGWSLTAIAQHFGVRTEEVIEEIRAHVREERQELKKLKCGETSSR